MYNNKYDCSKLYHIFNFQSKKNFNNFKFFKGNFFQKKINETYLESKTSKLISEIHKKDVDSPKTYLIKVSELINNVDQKSVYENVDANIKLIKLFKLLIQKEQIKHLKETQNCIDKLFKYFVNYLDCSFSKKQSKL